MSERVEPLEAGPSDVWERVRQFVHSTRKTIQVVVAYNADAAAASVTLMALFKESLISFSVHPVSGYDELTQVVEQTNLAQDFAVSGDGRREDELFVLVGLGAPVDLRQYFDFSRHIVVVLDSYRPIHLSTLRIEDGVRCILWNRQLIRAEVNSFFRAERAADLLRQRRQRRKREEKRHTQRTRTEVTGAEGQGPENNWDDSDSEDSLDLSTSSEDDVDEEQEEPLSQSQVEVNWMAEPDDEDEGGLPSYLEKLYYSAECAGRSCAVEVYDLAVLLNRMKPPMLWHAAIGVTDLFSRRLIDYGKYLVEMRPLHDAVTLQRSMARRGILEEVTEESLNAPEKRFHSSTMQLQNMDEPQLLLLRHTNLWSAIWHHPVTASALGLHHTEEGQVFLSQLLASRCGVSLKMAHQPWREVPRETQKEALRFVQAELQHVLESKASYLSYPNTIRCVGRSVGYSAEVSTFDACILFEACMAAVPPTSIYSVESTMSPDQAELLVADRLRNFYRTQFWRAHAVLDVDPNDKVFSEALQEAVLLHRAVTDATGALMQPGILQSTRGIHYVQPSDPTRTTGALESFSSVYRLGALTTRLLYSLTTERGGGRFSREVRPLLLTCALPSPKPQASASSSESHSGLIQSNNTFTDGSSPATAQGPSTGAVVTSAAVDVTAWSRQKVHFAALISHEGVTQGRMAPIPHMGCFNSCVEDDEEFVTLPARQWTQRNVVVVDSRESASHLTELLHLRSLERWDPRRDRPSWTS